ncbi:MAG TPA: zinc-binding dehydrogenase [Anaerolineae bacterium]|nr:zinc-binding dehydrogenase [Anaerolineae bacterium]
MRAILFEAPRKIRLIDDMPMPELEEGEVLVRCTHLGLCGGNVGPYTGAGHWADVDWPAPPGWQGHESVGIIVESRNDDWPVGTPVLAQDKRVNGFVEYIVPAPRSLCRLPTGIDDMGQFVLAQPLATVLRALAATRPVIGECCAVIGQGPIGLMFTYLLEQFGASRVLAADAVPWRLEWSRRLGASDVLDTSQCHIVEAVRGLTGGKMVDLCVEAAHLGSALVDAALLPRRQGRLCVFGVSCHDHDAFPWNYTTANETEIVITRGTGWMDYAQLAIDRLNGDWAELTDLVTPRLPWERAQEAFEMYAYPADHEGSLKVVLDL